MVRILLILLILTPALSYADDKTLSNFTKSISAVYTSSKSCENTISPGPKEYIEVISKYFSELYPRGTSYWIVPQYGRVIDSQPECIKLMQAKLYEYRVAYNNYNNAYPDRSPAPILISYDWNDLYVETEKKRPVKSYVPSRQKFAAKDFSRQ